LPGWIRYDARTLTLHCERPPPQALEVRLMAVAKDYDGLEAHSAFVVRRVLEGN